METENWANPRRTSKCLPPSFCDNSLEVRDMMHFLYPLFFWCMIRSYTLFSTFKNMEKGLPATKEPMCNTAVKPFSVGMLKSHNWKSEKRAMHEPQKRAKSPLTKGKPNESWPPKKPNTCSISSQTRKVSQSQRSTLPVRDAHRTVRRDRRVDLKT